MAVGVPEGEVFAAADAVLARGERPTVERVRLELGRGSPARVGGLLDKWWEGLSLRLQGQRRLPELPAEISQAFVAVWELATNAARGLAEAELKQQRQVLVEERARVAETEASARQQCAQHRQHTATAVAAQQLAETRVADLEQLLLQRQSQINDLQGRCGDLSKERDESRRAILAGSQQLQALRESAEQARFAQDAYTRGVEERAYQEVDRLRQEIKDRTQQLNEKNGRIEELQRSLSSVQAELNRTHLAAVAQQARNDAQAQEARQTSTKLKKPSARRNVKRFSRVR
ncbi:DNA-binding protein [Pseudomonas matsuisoli]|uniref:KfrA N-terminal DNA-binding domain-containing protein n=1 Tax=Pseudomonas matsuisoli TaxID=1515666 RepID=A0A917PPH8_9PSED|nr:DNA-binding protein [Pseudomonas matsuisoli]GGJ86493.1 hypothetical protein GCM10009304_10630 [Pseudomonas matsuisoli]